MGDGWSTDAVTWSTRMFGGCTSLVGGSGTTYDDDHVEAEYAHIDGGPSNPGYLTKIEYGIIVGGISVNMANASNVTGVGITDGTVSYNPATHTLTLNNASVTSSSSVGILVTENFVGDTCYINLVGENHLNITDYLTVSIWKATSITGNGTLEMGSGGITLYRDAPLVIEGGCTVKGHRIMGSSSGNEALTIRGANTVVDLSHTIWGLASLTMNDGLGVIKPVGGYYDPSSRWMKNANGSNCSTGVIIKQKPLEAYACLNLSLTTLTFYYDKLRSTREGFTYDLNTGSNVPGWYGDGFSYGVTKVVFDPSFASVRPTSTNRWFAEMYELTNIQGIQYLNTSEVADMFSMFWECGALPAVDVSGFDTHNVTCMASMFSQCYELTAIDVSGWNTSKVTDMSWMFCDCSELTSLDVSHFNTANVTNMENMFDDCYALTSLDLSSFNTANVTKMYLMFYECTSLTNLDLSSFNTANVTSMSNMFYNCNGLTSLDLSNFNTAKVTDMSNMFSLSENLRTIYAGDGWSTAAVTNSNNMFNYCTSLVGSRGTTYDANHVDKAYAHIDGGTSNPGYLSEKSAYRMGDVNHDGDVDVADVSLLIKVALGQTVDTVFYPEQANLDADPSSIDVGDVSALINLALGK